MIAALSLTAVNTCHLMFLGAASPEIAIMVGQHRDQSFCIGFRRGRYRVRILILHPDGSQSLKPCKLLRAGSGSEGPVSTYNPG